MDDNTDYDRLRNYIHSVIWKNAKTYESFAPHEYTVVHWNAEKTQEFRWFARLIKQIGKDEKFGKTTYRYLTFEGYKYWIMSAPDYATLINRAIP